MKTILSILYFFSTIAFSAAQVAPWTYTPTSVRHKINISEAKLTIDNRPLQAGDVVGVFYDSAGSFACGGYAVWPSVQIVAYGNDSGIPGEPNGFSQAGSGEPFTFKIWDKQRNCVVDSGTIIQFQTIPPQIKDSIYFQNNGMSKLITLNGLNKQVYYAKASYCAGDADPLPVKIGTIADLTFSSQAGLVINPATGQINIAASQPGTYRVYFHTTLCLRQTSMRVTIKMNLDNLRMSVTQSTCTEKGSIEIDPSSIVCGTGPFQYRLRNVLTGQETIYSDPILADLEDATYELYIKDAASEEIKWSRSITMTKNCKDLVIAPNAPGGQSATYYIPYTGKAKIYDRFGQLTKEMSIPADWDATDNTGNLVPMGQYIIICNENQQIVITVIK